jgi:hypothetical protein
MRRAMITVIIMAFINWKDSLIFAYRHFDVKQEVKSSVPPRHTVHGLTISSSAIRFPIFSCSRAGRRRVLLSESRVA